MWMPATFRNKRIIEKRVGWTRAQVLAYQQQRFRELLRHVWDNSPFYHDFYADHGIHEADLDHLTVRDLPIVSKEVLMEGFDRISNDEALRRDALEAWIHSDTKGIYRNRYVVLHTSGSSGNLGIFVYDKEAWTRIRGVTTRGAKLRINPFNRIRLAWYGASHGRFAGVTSCRTLPRLFCNRLLCSVLDPFSKTVEELNRFQPEFIFGYAAAVHELAEAALAGKLNIRPEFVGTSGEVLTETAAASIESAWGVKPTNAYGTSESLCLGLQLNGQNFITLMEDENLIEILDEKNEPVAPGEVGRVVVTALYNRAMPIARYDLRDFVTRGHRAEGAQFDNILGVRGRVEESLPVTLDDGSVDSIHPVVLSEFFVPGIRRFQFVGESPGRVILRYVADSDIDVAVSEAFGDILEMKGARGRTEVALNRVNELPADPATGKYRLVLVPGSPTAEPLREPAAVC